MTDGLECGLSQRPDGGSKVKCVLVFISNVELITVCAACLQSQF